MTCIARQRTPSSRGLPPGARRTAPRRRSGVVLPTVLVIMLTVCLVVGLVSRFSIRSMRLARRALDVERAFVVAEGGLGYGVMRVRNILAEEKVAGIRAKYTTITAPASPDSAYELKVKVVLGSGSDAHGSVDTSAQTVTVFAGARNLESGVACALKQVISTSGTSLSDYAAFYDGDFEACPGSEKGLTFLGKIHTNGDLYITKRATFGRNITAVGSFWHKRKNTGLDDSWHIRDVKIRYGDDEAYPGDMKDKNDLKSDWDGNHYIDSSLGTSWSSEGRLRYGKAIQTGDDGVTRLEPPIGVDDDNHALIEPPITDTTDPHYNKDTESQKFANKAALYLHVDSWGNVKLYDNVHYGQDVTSLLKTAHPVVRTDDSYWSTKTQYYGLSGLKGSTPHYCTIYDKDLAGTGSYNLSGNGFIQTDNCFVDRRVQWVMRPVDLYLDKMLEPGSEIRKILDATETAGTGKEKIIYVQVDDPPSECWNGNANNWLPVARRAGWNSTDSVQSDSWRNDYLKPIPCVRVRNGADLKGCDISIVTSRHLYVEGNFNTNGKTSEEFEEAGSSEQIPSAMLVGDTITTLSTRWQQHQYDYDYSCNYLDQNRRFVWDSVAAKAEKNQPDSSNTYIKGVIQSWLEPDSLSNETLRGKAARTTVNAVCMLGILPSLTPEVSGNSTVQGVGQDKYYSGGLENIFRWIENWSSVSLDFNGSFICLWDVREPDYRWRTHAGASGGAQNSIYHCPPILDSWKYRRMTPPGLPNFYGASEKEWARIPWSSVDWGESGD